MKKYLKQLVSEVFDEKGNMLAYKAAKELSQNQFSYIGIARLEEVINKIKETNPTEKYVSMAELFSVILRDNLEKENSTIIHNYFELKPTLQKYYNSIEKSTLND